MRYFTAHGENRRLDSVSRRELRGSFVELSDGVTHYELTGPDDGELVLLLGGLTIPLFYWDDLAAVLHTHGLRTLALSAYGRGYSDRVEAVHDEDLFVRQLTELGAALGLDGPRHVVGTSMGALVAMAYVTRHPALTTTLTLAGPAGLGAPAAPGWLLRSDTLVRTVARRFGRRILERHLSHNVGDPRLAARLTAMILDSYTYEGSLYAMFATLQGIPLANRAETYRRAAQARVPTLLLWGADDRVTPLDGLDRAVELLRPDRFHIIEDCGHMAPYERPGEVAAELVAFMTSTEARRPRS
ncbi:alpha/beta fold hydrolase [Streptomyces sp. NPDC101175]|uniref:alpha/beta fold hydrolase n=1 Tax=Streptomyces sp. NPDC101175 TaxID=3366123 RepID=UPI003837AD5D